MEEQEKMKGKEPFEFEEEPFDINKQAEQVALATHYTIIMTDDERFILIEGYCKTCKSKTIKLLSNKTRRVICTGCGKELAKL